MNRSLFLVARSHDLSELGKGDVSLLMRTTSIDMMSTLALFA
jgi:hypothetical protein